MVKIVIAGYYGLGNVGDEMILSGIISSIKRHVEDPHFSVITNDPVDTWRLHSVETIQQSFKKGMVSFTKNQFTEREFLNVLNAISSCDIFILGGGELLQDLKVHYLPLLLSMVKIAQVKGKKTVVYGIGAGPIDTKFGKYLCREILRKVDLITVRDKKSRVALENCGVSSVIQTADPAFGVDKPDKQELKSFLKEFNVTHEGGPVVGATFCNLLYNDDLYRKTNGPRFNWTKRRAILASLFDDLINQFHFNMVYFPTVYADYEGCLRISGLMKKSKEVTVMAPDSDFKRVLALTSSLEMLIGMRLHSLIISAIMGVPFVPLSYSSKVKSFLDSLGLGSIYVDIEEIEKTGFKQKFFSNVSEVWKNRTHYSEVLLNRTEALRNKAIENGRMVSELL